VIGAGVVIAVGNVINTVYASVVERFRELGIRRCVGASRTQIQRLIMIEALWLWLVGSLSGVAAGWGAYVSAAHAWGFSIFVDWAIVCTAVGIALVLTLVGATWPAVMATRLTPIEALSRE
jgi:putative ABC transport system permease protein